MLTEESICAQIKLHGVQNPALYEAYKGSYNRYKKARASLNALMPLMSGDQLERHTEFLVRFSTHDLLKLVVNLSDKE
jgi:hypothetical protein